MTEHIRKVYAPMTETAFYILLCLQKPGHGYGVVQQVEKLTGGFIRDNFFGRTPATKGLVDHLTDDDIWNLKRGGHDYHKVFAAYQKAVNTKGKPTVIIANTTKGYGSALMENKADWHHHLPNAQEYQQIIRDFARRKEAVCHG